MNIYISSVERIRIGDEKGAIDDIVAIVQTVTDGVSDETIYAMAYDPPVKAGPVTETDSDCWARNLTEFVEAIQDEVRS